MSTNWRIPAARRKRTVRPRNWRLPRTVSRISGIEPPPDLNAAAGESFTSTVSWEARPHAEKQSDPMASAGTVTALQASTGIGLSRQDIAR